MKYLILFMFFWCPFINASPIWLKIGEVKSIPASPTATVRVGHRGVVRVVEQGSAIQLIGLKPGVTAVAVDGVSHTVTVSRGQIKEFFHAVRDTLRTMKGLKLATDTQPIEVYGTLLRFSDWLKIADLARAHGAEFIFRAQALPDVGPQALRHFTQIAKEKGIPIVRFSSDPQFTVHVPTGQKGLTEIVRETFAPYGIAVRTTTSQLDIQPLVRTEVVLAEVSRSKGRMFGLEWPAGYQAQLLPKIAGVGGLMVTLQALEASGQAQILASPNLLCRSGGEAQFHAGGEFPVRLISRGTKDVIWKKHGVILNVKPKADFSGALSIAVETEVSLLDSGNAVDGIPALKTNRVKSHFDIPGRRTIALSGLLRQELGRAVSGLPLLSEIPVLGALFSSRQFQARESELVIFVTPEVHSPEDDAPLAMPKGWIRHEW